MLEIISTLQMNAGLSGIVETLKNNWIAPVFILIVAAVAIKFLISHEIRKLLVFIVIAAIVGALIFFGSALFGQGGSLSKWASNQGQSINTIVNTSKFWL